MGASVESCWFCICFFATETLKLELCGFASNRSLLFQNRKLPSKSSSLCLVPLRLFRLLCRLDRLRVWLPASIIRPCIFFSLVVSLFLKRFSQTDTVFKPWRAFPLRPWRPQRQKERWKSIFLLHLFLLLRPSEISFLGGLFVCWNLCLQLFILRWCFDVDNTSPLNQKNKWKNVAFISLNHSRISFSISTVISGAIVQHEAAEQLECRSIVLEQSLAI